MHSSGPRVSSILLACLAASGLFATPLGASCDPPCPGQICCADGDCVDSVSDCNSSVWQRLVAIVSGDDADVVVRGRFLDPSGFQATVLLRTREPDLEVNGSFDCRSPLQAEIVCTDRRGRLRFTVNYASLAPYLLTENLRTDETFEFPLSQVALREQ